MCGLIHTAFLPKAKVYRCDFYLSIFENQKGVFFLFISTTSVDLSLKWYIRTVTAFFKSKVEIQI